MRVSEGVLVGGVGVRVCADVGRKSMNACVLLWSSKEKLYSLLIPLAQMVSPCSY